MQLYGDNGYVNFTAVPTLQLDKDRGTVVLTISIDEGDQFTFGQLSLAGQETRAGEADFLSSSVTLANYVRAYGSAAFWRTTLNTLSFAFAVFCAACNDPKGSDAKATAREMTLCRFCENWLLPLKLASGGTAGKPISYLKNKGPIKDRPRAVRTLDLLEQLQN